MSCRGFLLAIYSATLGCLMGSPITDALHHALSVMSNESHAAVMFMLDDKYGVKIHGLSPVTMDDIRTGLQDIFGAAADILVHRMDEYLLQHSMPASTINVKAI